VRRSTEETITQAAGVVGVATTLSRVFGFARDVLIAHIFGASTAADAFFIAFTIPNVVRRLVGEGALSSAMVPVLTATLRSEGRPGLVRATNALWAAPAVGLGVLSGAGVLASPWLVRLMIPGLWEDPERLQLTTELTRLMFPFLWWMGLAAVAMGVSNTLGHFAVPAGAPILMNIVMIGCALSLAPLFETPIYSLAIGVVAGGAAQWFVQLPLLRRLGVPLCWVWDWHHPALRRILWLTLPAVFGLAVSEWNLLVDRWLAAFLPAGSVSYLYYGNRLAQFPLGVFGAAMSVAALPVLSAHTAQRDAAGFIQSLAFALRLLLFLTLPATGALIVLREPIVTVLFERGEFSRPAVEGTAAALLYYAVGLCAFAGLKVVVPAFYALQDTKTPVKIGTYAMLLNLGLSVALILPMRHGGLALATSLAAYFNLVGLLVLLRRRLGPMQGRSVLRSACKVLVVSVLIAALAGWWGRLALEHATTGGIRALALGGIVLGGTLCYSGLMLLWRSEEAVFLLEMGRRWWRRG
jgi:putative peptidoglycan lipid II flippase